MRMRRFVCLALACAASAGARAQETVDAIALPAEAAPPPPAESMQWNLIGDVQVDAALATSASGEGDPANLRRARLGFVIDPSFDWRVRLSADFGKYRGLRDGYAEYRGWPVYVAAGRMVEPFGLLQGSASGAALMERPQPMTLGPGYGLGVQANYAAHSWAATLGAFDATQNSEELGGREEEAVTGRITAAPVHTADSLLHVGLALSQRESGEGLAQFDAIPETSLLDNHNTQSIVASADDGSPGENRYWIAGLETAWHRGSWLVQAEYLETRFSHVNTRNPNTDQLEEIPSPRFHGYYVEASWVVTGERREYSTRRGAFGNVYPAAPWVRGGPGRGAFELAARASRTDLRYDVRYHGGTGDLGEVYSGGVNWYASDVTKLMLSVLQINRRSAGSVGDDGDDPGNPTRKDWIVQARLQWYFVVP